MAPIADESTLCCEARSLRAIWPDDGVTECLFKPILLAAGGMKFSEDELSSELADDVLL